METNEQKIEWLRTKRVQVKQRLMRENELLQQATEDDYYFINDKITFYENVLTWIEGELE